MASVRVTGAHDLAVVSAKAKAAGRSAHRRLNKGIRNAVKPTIETIKGEEGVGRLPSGLTEWMQDMKITTRIKAYGTTAGIRVVAAKRGHDVYTLDKGTARHPVFGRAPWVDQAVSPGFFSDVVQDERDEMFTKVRAEFDTFLTELAL